MSDLQVSDKERKDRELSLDWTDVVALVIAILETVFISVFFYIAVLLIIAVVLLI